MNGKKILSLLLTGKVFMGGALANVQGESNKLEKFEVDKRLHGDRVSSIRVSLAANVRSGPSLKYTPLYTLNAESIVKITKQYNKFYEVEYSGGQLAYIAKWLVARYGYVDGKGNEFQVYNKPTSTSEVIETFQNDMRVEVINKVENYYEINLEDGTGFIHTDYIDFFKGRKGKVITNAIMVGIHIEPNEKSKVIETTMKTEKLTIIEENNGYYKVCIRGKEGFILKEHIKLDEIDEVFPWEKPLAEG